MSRRACARCEQWAEDGSDLCAQCEADVLDALYAIELKVYEDSLDQERANSMVGE